MLNSKRLKVKHAGAILILTALILAVPTLFQNCAPPVTDGRDVSSVASSAPFAFEAKVDHIAYMSCSNMTSGYDPNTFFTFKAGAYNDGSGVRFNSDYVYAVRNLLQPDKAAVLQESPLNQNAVLQLSVRTTANFQTSYQNKKAFIGSLSDPSIATELARVNGVSYSRVFPYYPNVKFESLLYFNGGESSPQSGQDLRSQIMSGQTLLSLNYSRTTNAAEAISPTAFSPTSIYGQGYRMSFVRGSGQSSAYSTGPERIMKNMMEFNLLTGQQTSAVWECNPNWVFLIINYADVAGPSPRALCNIDADPVPTAAQAETYDIIRKVLPADSWYVDLNRRCVVPKPTKAGACYGSSNPLVNYSGGVCDYAAGTCPHYVSVCKRR